MTEGSGVPGDVRTIAIVGAGVSGVVAARMLSDAGFSVTVFEKAADVGGVWSASRAYPRIATQDDRRSYTFSDTPMPEGVAEHPVGADVRAYLERYLETHGLTGRVRLSTAVVRADLDGDAAWTVRSSGPDGDRTERFDWLVAANGVFSTPHVPDWPGRAAFEAAGGRVLSPDAIGDGTALHGRRVVVVGWGKTACDIAAAIAPDAGSVDVVVRTLVWKYPKRIGTSAVTFRHLSLTRLAEDVLTRPYRSPDGRIMLRRLPERVPRKAIERVLMRAIDRHVGFRRLGLLPAVGLASTNSLVTEGFFEGVADGSIRVRRDTTVLELGGDASGPWVRLADGTRLPADVVAAATGYDQTVAFLADDVLERALTPEGDLLLHRRVLAVDVPRLAFVGWAHSYRSPLTSEIAAVWLAAALTGAMRLPARAAQCAGAARFHPVRGRGVPARAPLPGVGLRDLDEQLTDLGVSLPRAVRLRQLIRPVEPTDYAASLRRAAPRRPRTAVPAGDAERSG